MPREAGHKAEKQPFNSGGFDILSEILWFLTCTGVWSATIQMLRCPKKKNLRLPGTLDILKSHKAEHEYVDL